MGEPYSCPSPFRERSAPRAGRRKNAAFARARLLEVLEPAAERIPPRCIHFGLCGGCHYQHLPYPAQLAAKNAILRDQLERLGGLKRRLSNPPSLLLRNTSTATISSPSRPRDGKLGYHKPRSDQVFAIQECHLPEPALDELWPQLDFEALAEIERIGLRLGAQDDIQIILESRAPQPPELSVEELPVSVVHLSPAGTLVLAGSPDITLSVLGALFRVSAGSFFQANTAIAQALVEGVLALLSPDQTSLVLEAYCGVGLFSAFWPPG